jgi:chromosome segregation ATPase
MNDVEDIRRELEKITAMYTEVSDDNNQLELDIEKYKENVRALSAQNEELIIELDKISEQDENVRYILNRKGRIESLIAKAEAQIARN